MTKEMDLYVKYDITKQDDIEQFDEEKSLYGTVVFDEEGLNFEGLVKNYNESKKFVVEGYMDSNMIIISKTGKYEDEDSDIVLPINLLNSNYYFNDSKYPKQVQYNREHDSTTRIRLLDAELSRNVSEHQVAIFRNAVDSQKRKYKKTNPNVLIYEKK